MKKISKKIQNELADWYTAGSFYDERLKLPHIEGDYVVFTDGKHLMMIHKDICSYFEKYPVIDQCKRPPIYQDRNRGVFKCDKILRMSALAQAYDKVEKGHRYRKECEACGGTGVVDFEFEYEGENYTTEDTCPVCHGDEYVSCDKYDDGANPYGGLVFKKHHYVGIGDAKFSKITVDTLLNTADILHVECFHQVLMSKTRENVFELYDGKIKIAVLPCLSSADDVVTRVEE